MGRTMFIEGNAVTKAVVVSIKESDNKGKTDGQSVCRKKPSILDRAACSSLTVEAATMKMAW